MTYLRSATPLWNNVAVSANGVSAGAGVSDAANVAFFITNSGALPTNITVQVLGSSSPSAGLNTDFTGTWFDYQGLGTITVGVGASICYDLSPFSPAFLRLKSSAATTLTAFVVSNG